VSIKHRTCEPQMRHQEWHMRDPSVNIREALRAPHAHKTPTIDQEGSDSNPSIARSPILLNPTFPFKAQLHSSTPV
jgi:hypothetical protein